MDYKFSKMSLDDLYNIKDSLITDFDNFWTYNILEQELSSNNSYFIIAKNDNSEIVGFAGIKIILDEADIMNIVVRKNLRNQGIGFLLLNNLISYCKNKNLTSINLEVKSTNLPAISLYEKCGFINLGIRKKYYNGTDDAIIMKAKIN